MKTVYLRKGDGLRILPETKEFLLGCCGCDLVHLIKVKREKDSIVLQFFRYDGGKKMKIKSMDEIKGKYKENDILMIELKKGDKYIGFFLDTTKFKTYPQQDFYLRRCINPKTILHHRIFKALVEFCLPVQDIVKITKLES